MQGSALRAIYIMYVYTTLPYTPCMKAVAVNHIRSVTVRSAISHCT